MQILSYSPCLKPSVGFLPLRIKVSVDSQAQQRLAFTFLRSLLHRPSVLQPLGATLLLCPCAWCPSFLEFFSWPHQLPPVQKEWSSGHLVQCPSLKKASTSVHGQTLVTHFHDAAPLSSVFVIPFSHGHVPGDYGGCLCYWNSTFLCASTVRRTVVTAVLFTASAFPRAFLHLIVTLLASTVGKVYSFFRVMSLLQSMQRENTHSQISWWPCECPRESQKRQLCPGLAGRKGVWKHRRFSQLSVVNVGADVKDLKLKLFG